LSGQRNVGRVETYPTLRRHAGSNSNQPLYAYATKAINDAMYGLMMVLDGATGALANDSMRVNLRVTAELVDTQTDDVVESLDLLDGDGMCMGYHGWLENEFGDPQPFVVEMKSKEVWQ
jgi:hypothetical protein